VGEYVAPILARIIEKQVKHLNPDQNEVYNRLKTRQCLKAIGNEFLKLKKPERDALIDKLADDIEGMVERRRTARPSSKPTDKLILRRRKSREFDAAAQNYERVDFMTDGEIVLDRPNDEGHRFVLAHAGFIERLYIQGEHGRIEFGVRRAFVSVDNHGPGHLSKVADLKGSGDLKNVYYTSLHKAPNAVTVCIDPSAGQSSLAELPLPPSRNENFLSKVAVASFEVSAPQLEAQVIVSLDVEGLFLTGHKDISPRTKAAIKAIMGVVKTKSARANHQTVDENGQLVRKLPVRERT
jgi:hypothetical protein